jgi:hypothetical protein
MDKKEIFIGVDIGKKGAIVALDSRGQILGKHLIPMVKDKVIDTELLKVFEQYSEFQIFICIEEVHSIYGTSAKSNFSFGEIFGKKKMIGAVLSVHYGATFDLVPPKKWQSNIWTSTDKIFKSGKRVDTKATSLVTARRLAPNETFLATSRSRVPHDGLVDAFLIAKYTLLKYGRDAN